MALNIDDVKFDDIPPGDKAYGHDAVMQAANNMAAMGVEAVSQAFEKSLGIDFGTLGERVAQDAVNKAKDTMLREAKEVTANMEVAALSSELGQPNVQYSGPSNDLPKPDLGVKQ